MEQLQKKAAPKTALPTHCDEEALQLKMHSRFGTFRDGVTRRTEETLHKTSLHVGPHFKLKEGSRFAGCGKGASCSRRTIETTEAL